MSKAASKIKSAPFILSVMLILTVVISVIFIMRDKEGTGAVVTIYSCGETVWSGRLDEITDEKILTIVPASGEGCPAVIEGTDTSGDHYNVVTVTPGGVRVTESDCKNRICIHRGMISSGDFPIACLPNRLIITVTSDSGSGADAYTY